MASRRLVVEIVGDAKKFQGATKDATGSLGKMEASLGGLGKKLAAGFAISTVVNFGKKAVDAASNLAETQSKVGVIFGKSADEVKAWGETAADAFGQSQRAALDGASTFATFGKAAGLAGDQLVGFATGLTELASDLASFHNTSPEEAVIALGAALRGETEPIRRFGVLLDDASLRAQALKMGLIATTTQALTPQQKVLAAHKLILEQTTDAQGDFERTSDGLANKQRELSAKFEDTAAAIGEKLLPVATDLVGVLGDALKVAGPLIGVLDFLGRGYDNLKAALFGDPEGTPGGPGGKSFVEMVIGRHAELPKVLSLAEGQAMAMAEANQGLAQAMGNVAYVGRGELTPTLWELSRAQEAVRVELSLTEAAFRNLRGELSNEEAILNLKDAFEEAGKAQEKAALAARKGWRNAGELAEEAQRRVIDLRNSVLDYGEGIGKLPREWVTKIDALIDEGSLEAAEQQLLVLARNRQVQLSIIARGGDVPVNPNDPLKRRALGGPVSAGVPYLVGERGPEVVVPGRSGRVVPNHAIGGVTIINNIAGSVIRERELYEGAHEYLLRKKQLSGPLGLD